MKKIIFILIVVASIVFTSCIANSPTKIKTLSADGAESLATFEDFFNLVELVRSSDGSCDRAIIVMDKNTGVLYIYKSSAYHWGMSPIYDSDGLVLTKEKWLARQAEKEVNCEKSKD